MTTAHEIEAALFDADGSVRDITFTLVPRLGIQALLSALNQDFIVMGATNSNGDDIRSQITSGALDPILWAERDHILSYWSSSTHVISELQVFVSWPEEDRYFIELTFNPRDLIRDRFNLDVFSVTLERWATILNAENYFVRYENASWRQFDDKAPDVIYTRETRPMQNKPDMASPFL